MRVLDIPMPLLTDTYKASHFNSYPKAKKMIAVGLHFFTECSKSYTSYSKKSWIIKSDAAPALWPILTNSLLPPISIFVRPAYPQSVLNVHRICHAKISKSGPLEQIITLVKIYLIFMECLLKAHQGQCSLELISYVLQYGEFRHGFKKDTKDTRLVFYGLRYILETHLTRKWTKEDVDKADLFFRQISLHDSSAYSFNVSLGLLK